MKYHYFIWAIFFTFHSDSGWSQHSLHLKAVTPFCRNGVPGYILTAPDELKSGFTLSYKWHTGETSQTIFITQDNHNLTTTRVSCLLQCGCGGIATVDTVIRFGPRQRLIAVTNASCFGLPDGKIEVNTNPGETVKLKLDNKNYINEINSLEAGVYQIFITDRFGCNSDTTIIISQPDSFQVSYSFKVRDVSCFGKKDGAVFPEQLIAESGKPCTVKWIDFPEKNVYITNLAAGEYTAMVLQKNGGCVPVKVKVNQPPPVNISSRVTSDFNGFATSCFNTHDGSACLSVKGGQAPYRIRFADSLPESTIEENEQQNFFKLKQGSYPIRLKDSKGCVAFDTVILKGPDKLSIKLLTPGYPGGFDLPCTGASAGIKTIISGGSGYISASWYKQNKSGTDFIDKIHEPVLSAGEYLVRLNDQNGCEVNQRILITQPPSVTYQERLYLNLPFLKIVQLKLSGRRYPYKFQDKNTSKRIIVSLFQKTPKIYKWDVAGANGCNKQDVYFQFGKRFKNNTQENTGRNYLKKGKYGCPIY